VRYRASFAKTKRRSRLRAVLFAIFWCIVGLYALLALSVITLRWINPVTTAVQMERRVAALLQHRPYQKRCTFVPLARISIPLQHAVIAAEDARFYQHHGFDWIEMRKVMAKNLERGKLGRGGSTITQQLAKNLFLTTRRSLLRKAAEAAIVPLLEGILGKRRIFELYLNVIEWGPGVYGAEAASEFYYHVPAAQVSREPAARLAACIPAPLTRRPVMNDYAADILDRMRDLGW
jgi:monofunctional biosynthetic peptidoglycan transglycosylase